MINPKYGGKMNIFRFQRNAQFPMMNTANYEWIITASVYQQIAETIGTFPAETGGVLGSSDGRHIDSFFFDQNGSTSSTTYYPDRDAFERIQLKWDQEKIRFVGFIHSHPFGYATLSQQDKAYAEKIITTMKMNGKLFTPIVQLDPHQKGKFTIHYYSCEVSFSEKNQPVKIENSYRRQEPLNYLQEKRDAASKERFVRIEKMYSLDIMARKTIVCVGTGGARTYLENMARCGVKNFILIDKDTISAANIATQGVFIDELGLNKAEIIKKRIQLINPLANVTVIPTFLDDSVTDSMFEEWIGQQLFRRPTDILIAGCTDSFFANARAANLSLKYGTLYIAAMLYQEGLGGEIYFSYPGITNNSCPRCAMSSRYDAYLKKGYQNDVTSDGVSIFMTERLNATKGQVSLMLLLYHEDKNCIYDDLLDKVADRNLILIRMSPFFTDKLGNDIFDKAFKESTEFTCFDETIWIPQKPDNPENGADLCPLCFGTGDLIGLKRKIEDSREIN